MSRCIDCLYFTPGSKGRCTSASCLHPALTEVSPVYGNRIAADPYAQRREGGGCGPNGRHFTPRPAAPSVPQKRGLWARLMQRSKEWA